MSLQDALILPNLALVITDYCTLKCQDCQFLIGEKTFHKHFSLDDCIAAIENISTHVDMIGRLAITGGEAFLYPELEKLLQYVCGIENILAYEILTNGATPLTDNLARLLHKYQVRVTLSDYGELSKCKSNLLEQTKKYNISLNIRPQDKTWHKLGEGWKRNREKEENEKLYYHCPFGGGCPTIVDGKFGMCGHAGFLIQEGRAPDCDRINLLNEHSFIREKIMELMSLSSLEACDYCDGIYGEVIAAGIQRERMEQ